MKKDLTALTGIRFLAAFYVFIFHMDMRLPFRFLSLRLLHIVGQGAIGVNIFFVLSGFILTYNYYKKEIPYKDFLKKRLIRIYPAYFVGFLLCLLISWPGKRIAVLDFFMMESYLPKDSMEWFGGGAWSISTEFFFYFLFPFIVPLIVTRSKMFLYLLLPILFVLGTLPGMLLNSYHFDHRWSYAFPPARLCEFVSGMAGGLFVFKHGARVKEWMAVAAIAITAAYFSFAGYKYQGWTVHNFLVIPTTLLILAVCVEPGRWFKWIGSKWMEYLGKVSYGFYIVQIPITLGLDELIAKGIVKATDLYLIPMILVVNLLASFALYEWIEMPIHRLLNKKNRDLAKPPAGKYIAVKEHVVIAGDEKLLN